MPRADMIEMEGIVTEALPSLKFRVSAYIKDGDPEKSTSIICTLSGKMMSNNIRILVGDKVTVEVSPYDLKRGRITWRYK